MLTGSQVRSHFHDLAFGRNDPGAPISRDAHIPDGIKGAINGILTRAAGSDANRKLVIKYLAGVTSSKDLTPGQWFALYCLVRPYKDEALGWISDNPKFSRAMGAVLAGIPRQAGQAEMELG